MKRLIFYITTPWGDDEAMSKVANKIEPHLQDREYMMALLSQCDGIRIAMGEHSKVEKDDDDDSCNN